MFLRKSWFTVSVNSFIWVQGFFTFSFHDLLHYSGFSGFIKTFIALSVISDKLGPSTTLLDWEQREIIQLKTSHNMRLLPGMSSPYSCTHGIEKYLIFESISLPILGQCFFSQKYLPFQRHFLTSILTSSMSHTSPNITETPLYHTTGIRSQSLTCIPKSEEPSKDMWPKCLAFVFQS